MGRGNTKEFDESNGNSWTYTVSPKKPFTGKFHFSMNTVDPSMLLLVLREEKGKDFFLSVYTFAFLLQKYRLGKSQHVEACIDNKQGD